MKRFFKIYIEISNICNLSCRFCPGTKREPRAMSTAEFSAVLQKVKPYTDYVYFHLMGEPLVHPHLFEFLDAAAEEGLKVILTTNGTLIGEHGERLLFAEALHKVNISLHAFEANDLAMPFSQYLSGCFEFGRAASGKKLVVYRLWNSGGEDSQNGDILGTMEKYFAKPWTANRMGDKIADGVYLEYGDRFDWPDMEANSFSGAYSCYGLRDQVGILADGSVVPCCLDHEGDITLGNIFESDLGDIINSDRATCMIDGFKKGSAVEPLCLRCGYANKKFG